MNFIKKSKMNIMKIGKTSVNAIVKVVKGIHYLTSYSSESVTEDRIFNYLEMSEKYAKDALEASIILDFVRFNQIYELTEAGIDICNSSNEQLWIIFRRKLLDFPPLTPLIRLMIDNNTLVQAVRKVIRIFDIEGNENQIMLSFKSWLRFCRIIDSDDTYIGEAIDLSLSNEYIEEVRNAIQNQISLRVFIENFFTTNVYSQMPSRMISLIITSFQIHQQTPELAIVNMGKALESYIRNLPIMLGISHRFNQNATLGILVNTMKNNPSIYPLDNKQIKILHGIIQPRNMSAHEPNNPHWDIKEDSALSTLLFYLSAIRSIHLLLFSQRRVF